MFLKYVTTHLNSGEMYGQHKYYTLQFDINAVSSFEIMHLDVQWQTEICSEWKQKLKIKYECKWYLNYPLCINCSLFNITIVVYTLSDGNIIFFSVQHLVIEPLSSLTHGPIYVNCK